MENTQPNQSQNQGQNKPQNQPANQPVKPFEKLQKQSDKPQINPPAKTGVPPVVPPMVKQTEKKNEKTSVKTDDKPYAAWAIGGMIVLALLFYGYQARQDGPVAEIDEESNGLTLEESAETEEDAEESAEEDTEDEVEDQAGEEELAAERDEEEGEVRGEAAPNTWSAPVSAPQPATVASTPATQEFEKDEDETLREAVMREFGVRINGQNCYLVDMPYNVEEGYVKVGIYAAPGAIDCGPAGWNNRAYFLMNTEVPEKFVAVYGAGGNVTIEE